MAVAEQVVADCYALYRGDAMEMMQSLPDERLHLSIYSPPFGGLYHYSSSERDLSNCDDYEQFFEMYGFFVRELHRLTMPGRISAVHAMPIPSGNTGKDHLIDFPGDIIRLHEAAGFDWISRYVIWKEPLAVRNRTMKKNLAHKTIVDDAAFAGNASADELLVFRRRGESSVPIAHPTGLTEYAGVANPPAEVIPYRGWTGKQTENLYSHWVWRRYASSIWDDIRIDRVLPYQEAKDEEDEKHVHPLQLDVIDRAIVLYSSPGETVFTPFMGVGSEVYSAVRNGRRGVGVELKPSYYRQAVKNLAAADVPEAEQASLLALDTESV